MHRVLLILASKLDQVSPAVHTLLVEIHQQRQSNIADGFCWSEIYEKKSGRDKEFIWWQNNK